MANSSRRPLLKSEIKHAQTCTGSAAEAARYLRVNYCTYKKYAKLYGIFEDHLNPSGKGRSRSRIKGAFGLDAILNGEHPNYNRVNLKERLIRAGLLLEACGMCGFSEKRLGDGKCPVSLISLDGDTTNLRRENLELRCLNCTFLTTGKISLKHLHDPSVYNADILTAGLTMDDINEIQSEFHKQNLESP
jgi:hypothetical protein